MLQHTIYAGIGVSLTNLNLHVLHFYRLVEGPVGRGIVHVHCSVARATVKAFQEKPRLNVR